MGLCRCFAKIVLSRFARHRLMKCGSALRLRHSAERDQSTGLRSCVPFQPPVCSLLRNRLFGGSVQRYGSRSCSRSRIVSWPNLRSSRFFTQRRTRNRSRSKNSTKSLGDFLPPLAERGPGQRFD